MGREDALQVGMATHSSVLAWRILFFFFFFVVDFVIH